MASTKVHVTIKVRTLLIILITASAYYIRHYFFVINIFANVAIIFSTYHHYLHNSFLVVPQ